jgi:predicted phosphodiesterase
VRVAALYDVHGNLPALDAVLDEVDAAGADLIVFGGDVAWGPLPRETVERLQDLDQRARFVRGNADREVAAGADESSGLDEATARVNLWCHRELGRVQLDWLAGWPLSVVVEVDGLGPVLFCHGSPRRDDESITSATTDAAIVQMLTGVAERTVVCGHTHAQFERRAGNHRVVNAGSVGLPFGEPGAYWVLLGPDVSLHRTDYDLDEAARFFRAKAGPSWEEFADSVRSPPPWETAAELFTDR